MVDVKLHEVIKANPSGGTAKVKVDAIESQLHNLGERGCTIFMNACEYDYCPQFMLFLACLGSRWLKSKQDASEISLTATPDSTLRGPPSSQMELNLPS